MNLDEKHTKKQAETKDFKLLERFRVKTQAILGLKKYQEKRGQHTAERFGITQLIWFQKKSGYFERKIGGNRAVGVLKNALGE